MFGLTLDRQEGKKALKCDLIQASGLASLHRDAALLADSWEDAWSKQKHRKIKVQ
jgi:hypothetical protein